MLRNPCTIRGADREYSPERPVASIAQVFALADAVGPRWRTLILLATFCSLRMGELSALARRDIDLDACTVTVRASASVLPGGRVVGPPKTRAGRRTVTIPAAIRPDVVEHLERFAQPGEDGAVFIGPLGGPLREGNFVTEVWGPARRAVGVPGLHFHDLRHTGNNLAAGTGASLRELMVRMGHGSTRAALRYQHATRDRDTAIARELSALIEQVRPSPPEPSPGPEGTESSDPSGDSDGAAEPGAPPADPDLERPA
jgi:integrase